jgi:putative DNA primase/helicase
MGQPVAEDAELLDPRDPMAAARAFVGAADDLRHQGDVFYRWTPVANAWLATEEAVVRAAVWAFLERARRLGKEPLPGSLATAHVPFQPGQRVVGEVLDAVRAVVNMPAACAAPRWLDGRDAEPLIALRNGLLRLRDRTLLPRERTYYNHVALPFDFAADAPEPTAWLAFLGSLWPEDPDSIECLREVFGYLVVGETRFQKIFMLVGPKRGGKGTIARVLRELLGAVNVCGPTLASLAETFGCEALVNKTLAVVSDARITGRSDTAVMVEQLLSISGEDVRSIARKFLPAWSGQLRVRFLLLTNELPRIEDASGALASRFVTLRLRESFLGREDHGLFDRLAPELPGILAWALDGWDRLRARGHFALPASARELVTEFEELGSPIATFVRERCELGAACTAPQRGVFAAWKWWCEENGRHSVGTSQSLARDLRAAFPGLSTRQLGPRGQQERSWVGLRLVPREEEAGGI